MTSSLGCFTDSLPHLNTSFLQLQVRVIGEKMACSISCFMFRFRSNPTSSMQRLTRKVYENPFSLLVKASNLKLGFCGYPSYLFEGSHNSVEESRCRKNCLTDCARAQRTVLAGGATAKSEALKFYENLNPREGDIIPVKGVKHEITTATKPGYNKRNEINREPKECSLNHTTSRQAELQPEEYTKAAPTKKPKQDARRA
ncbi:hypothetical protein F2Q70_00020174 [Brassica cretica]|uniref:Uncharacterized protein n=1 Tax=Brassica cretica TaxID=69181 RepID=A0A8S9GRW8_BRACR|nr:hypothetical protein F2Q70_00020174 [Brassica cretica]